MKVLKGVGIFLAGTVVGFLACPIAKTEIYKVSTKVDKAENNKAKEKDIDESVKKHIDEAEERAKKCMKCERAMCTFKTFTECGKDFKLFKPKE